MNWIPNLPRILKHLLTDNDNETYDTTRVLFVIAMVYGLYMKIVDHSFDMQAYGIGMGALTAAFGIAKKQEGNP